MNRSTFLKIALASATPISAQNKREVSELLNANTLAQTKKITDLPETRIMTIPPLITVRPMLMLTGFLGAGKTTLLRSLLKELTARNHLADVILNDRENALIDKETLKEDAATLAALTASCVCCDGVDELCQLALTASKSKNSSLLVEINGTADPIPLLETFTLLESDFYLRPRWLVCVIDARQFGKRGQFNELERTQFETASHYYLSHSSDLTEAQQLQLEEDLKAINSRASRATATSLAAALSQAIRQNRGYTFARKNSYQLTNSSPKTISHPRQASSRNDCQQLAHQFTGCRINFPHAVEPSRVKTWLQQLPDSVIRAKALVTLTDAPDSRFLFERVGQEVSPDPIQVPTVSSVPCAGLFIGPELQPEEILKVTRAILHPDCHFPAA
ncbi:MAG: G3E family GTPase [Akkermansiaceae bacterium]|jgi:G3E family GTPase